MPRHRARKGRLYAVKPYQLDGKHDILSRVRLAILTILISIVIALTATFALSPIGLGVVRKPDVADQSSRFPPSTTIYHKPYNGSAVSTLLPPTTVSVNGPSSIPSTTAQLVSREELDALSNQVKALQDELEEVKRAIRSSPELSLRVPLLEEKIDNLSQDLAEARTSTENQWSNANREADRLYDLMKWVIGAVVLGIIGFIISLATVILQFVKGKHEPPSGPQSKDERNAA